MEAKRGLVMNCVFVIVLITKACMVTAVEAGSSSASSVASGGWLSKYKALRRQDWNTFLQYMKKHQPPLTLERCNGVHVIEFLKLLDAGSRTIVHVSDCPHFGNPNKLHAPCATCPFNKAWRSLYDLIVRLSTAYRESGGRPESNPFGAPVVKNYLLQVRECQAKARGIPYQEKKRKRATIGEADGASSGGAGSEPAADIFFI